MNCVLRTLDSLSESSYIIADLKVHVHDSSIEASLPVERDFVAGRSVVVHAGGHCCHVRLGEGVKERPEVLGRPARGMQDFVIRLRCKC